MLTGELRSRIDRIWNDFWSDGISNPLEVIEQLTYLLFVKRLDELQTLEDRKAARLGGPVERRIFPEGRDGTGCPYEDMRWSKFKNFAPGHMFEVVDQHLFPFLRTLGERGRLTPPTCGMLASRSRAQACCTKAVDGPDEVPMIDRDTKGDVYEYMLSKIATSGKNGQFRTPRRIIQLMVEMTSPQPKDVICDPACGTCGFLLGL